MRRSSIALKPPFSLEVDNSNAQNYVVGIRAQLEPGQQIFVKNNRAAVLGAHIERTCHPVTDMYLNAYHVPLSVVVPVVGHPAIVTIHGNALHYRIGSLLCGTTDFTQTSDCLDNFIRIHAITSQQVCLESATGSLYSVRIQPSEPQWVILSNIVAFEDSVCLDTKSNSKFQRNSSTAYVLASGGGWIWLEVNC